MNKMKEAIETLKKRNYTYLIYDEENTWCSKGIDPINSRITREPCIYDLCDDLLNGITWMIHADDTEKDLSAITVYADKNARKLISDINILCNEHVKKNKEAYAKLEEERNELQ